MLKVLSNINNDGDDKLDDIVTADAGYFHESQKGNKCIETENQEKEVLAVKIEVFDYRIIRWSINCNR